MLHVVSLVVLFSDPSLNVKTIEETEGIVIVFASPVYANSKSEKKTKETLHDQNQEIKSEVESIFHNMLISS